MCEQASRSPFEFLLPSLKVVLSASGVLHVKQCQSIYRCTSFNCISVFSLWYTHIAYEVLPVEVTITLEAFLMGSNWLPAKYTHCKEDQRHYNKDRDLLELLNTCKLIRLSTIEWFLIIICITFSQYCTS